MRVLIVRIGAMGDVLHGIPAVAGLREAMPECMVGWAVEPRWMALLRTDRKMPLVDRVHEVRTREWKRSPFSLATVKDIARLRRELREQRYDVCVDLQGSIRSALTGWMAGAKRFVGPEKPRETAARRLYDERVSLTATNVIGQACELVSAGAGRNIEPAAARLPIDAGAEAWCDEVLDGRPFVLLAPTAGWGAKEWGAERFAELARGLEAAGYRVLVNAAEGSTSTVADEITRRAGARMVASTLPQMIALTRHAALVVGGDTGPVHLAASLGRPVVALFGPTDPERNGPSFPGAKAHVLRDSASITDHRRHTVTEAGLARIRVEEVLAASLAMLREG